MSRSVQDKYYTIIQDSRGKEEELLLPATTGPRSDHIIYENIERGSLNITLWQQMGRGLKIPNNTFNVTGGK